MIAQIYLYMFVFIPSFFVLLEMRNFHLMHNDVWYSPDDPTANIGNRNPLLSQPLPEFGQYLLEATCVNLVLQCIANGLLLKRFEAGHFEPMSLCSQCASLLEFLTQLCMSLIVPLMLAWQAPLHGVFVCGTIGFITSLVACWTFQEASVTAGFLSQSQAFYMIFVGRLLLYMKQGQAIMEQKAQEVDYNYD